MAVTYATNLKADRMTAIITRLDAQSGNAILKIGTSGMATTLVSITLAKPSATVSGGVLTFSGLPKSATATGAGTAAAAQLTDSAGTVWIDGLTVGTGGTNVVIDNTNIAVGQTVNFNATSTITHA
jgi:hypothetical protein